MSSAGMSCSSAGSSSSDSHKTKESNVRLGLSSFDGEEARWRESRQALLNKHMSDIIDCKAAERNLGRPQPQQQQLTMIAKLRWEKSLGAAGAQGTHAAKAATSQACWYDCG